MRKARKFVQGRVFRRVFRAVPKGWFSHDFDVFDPAGTRVATADLSDWSENAELEVRGTRYMARHQTLAQEFSLEEEDGLRLAVAEKPSAWRETFSLEHGPEIRLRAVDERGAGRGAADRGGGIRLVAGHHHAQAWGLVGGYDGHPLTGACLAAAGEPKGLEAERPGPTSESGRWNRRFCPCFEGPGARVGDRDGG
jgi:hypothetical protein